ncbi:MAG: bifunctional phosphoribosyl-AMP cyclohydrolase/phosphoribosyl-ATP diphosphatase HisIE [Sodaliphilus sp.]
MDIDFNKLGGLVPAVVQDAHTKNVLMVGFMNQEALDKTLETKKVTFWSRTRQKLWTKGEQSGHFLDLVKMEVDCDRDTLLVHAIPNGPVCHTGSATCFSNDNSYGVGFLSFLQDFINRRRDEMPEGSYTTSLFKAGVNRMAQKVGEEALETALEAANGTPGRMIYEASDMLYHLIVLLASKGLRIEDVVADLESRHGKTKNQYNKHQE